MPPPRPEGRARTTHRKRSARNPSLGTPVRTLALLVIGALFAFDQMLVSLLGHGRG